MDNGLFLSLDDFGRLPAKSKLNCLYDNQLKTFTLLSLHKKTNLRIQFHQKIQYVSISVLMAGFIFLIKQAIGGS